MGGAVKHRRRFPAIAASVRAARGFVDEALPDGFRQTSDDVALMVSELASNVVQHALSSFDLAVCGTPRELMVEVTDFGDGIPAMASPSPDATQGRGLRIVDMLSTRWGVSGGPGSGKTVWFVLALPGADAAAAVGPRSALTAGAATPPL